ncbi:MAG: hypothetical protein ACE5FU_01525 [Nitrospinota bacterium]
MGTKKDIALKITEKEPNYIFALKGDQSTLSDDVRLFFEDKELTEHLENGKEADGGNERVEVRKCTVTADIEF